MTIGKHFFTTDFQAGPHPDTGMLLISLIMLYGIFKVTNYKRPQASPETQQFIGKFCLGKETPLFNSKLHSFNLHSFGSQDDDYLGFKYVDPKIPDLPNNIIISNNLAELRRRNQADYLVRHLPADRYKTEILLATGEIDENAFLRHIRDGDPL
jgi:hypothetical protein